MDFEVLEHSHRSPAPRLVERAFQHWEASRQAAAADDHLPAGTARAFTIALSRQAGTHGTAVAQEVGKLLGWHVYDHELLEHIAKEMGLRTALLESIDEKNQNWLLETIQAFASMPSTSEYGAFVSESSYVHHLVQTVLALGIHGESVIVGRGASFILPTATTLRVRLVAPLAERVAVIAKKFSVSEKEAARRVRTTDREQADFVRDHFLKNPADPQDFDLILNTGRFSVPQTAELVVQALRRCNGNDVGKSGSQAS